MKQLSVDEFDEFLRENPKALVVNLQPRDDRGRIPNSVNVPLEDADFIHKISSFLPYKDQPIIVYSETADEAEYMNASDQLVEAGYDNVLNLRGGLREWINAGRKVEEP